MQRRFIMKRLLVAATLTVALFAAAGGEGAATARLGSSAEQPQPTYFVTNLPSLGGSVSAGASINNRAWVAGSSNLAGDQTQHAALWRNGTISDLGTLGGPNSGVLWPVKNDRGLIVGISQTAQPDPLGERWSCAAFFPAATGTGYQCLGFAWRDGVMRALPTLGGTNGFATGANERGEIVGWAENTVHDPTCVAPQVLQFRAVIWGPKDDQIQELPPLPGDTVSAATAINNRGQVVGISGICDRAVGRFSAAHAVLWQDGKPIDLGGLGGVAWNTPMAINERGDVVGFANASAAAGGSFAAHAFLWTKHDGMRDLGTLPGDTTSQALGINDRREIVGTSCDADFNCRAFLWREGHMTDLNTLVAGEYDATLLAANDINEAGRITGQALAASGELLAFVAVPEAGRR
jgi:probable HAF family extracellular repeat protein